MAKTNAAREDDQDDIAVPPLANTIFAGQQAAQTLAGRGEQRPLIALNVARLLKEKGASDARIVREMNKVLEGTPYAGAAHGADGEPRFEISDKGAKLKTFDPKGGQMLGDVLHHPEFFKAYPDASFIGIRGMPGRGAGYDGNDVSLGENNYRKLAGQAVPTGEAVGSVLHEVQHHAQGVEGHADGGSPDHFKKWFPGKANEKLRIELYGRLAGELEAEQARIRQTLSAEERRTIPAKDYVPRANQIVTSADVLREAARIVEANPGIVGNERLKASGMQQRRMESVVDNKPIIQKTLSPTKIKADPATFQFKSGGNHEGVTDRLQGVKKWDQVAAGNTIVFERKNGELVIADGHQRRGLALRAVAAGQKNVKMNAFVFREKDGWKASDVYAIAAMKNIKESSGNALDMAKVMRARPDLLDGSVPMSDAKVRDARSLSKLSDAAFDLVAKGAVKQDIAVPVGDLADSARHVDLLKEMAKAKISTAQHARLYVGQALAAPSIEETTHSLFGVETQQRSLLAERAAVLNKAMDALRSDKRIFGMLQKEAGVVEAAGNRLAKDVNAQRATDAANLNALVEKLAATRGPVSDMLNRAATSVAGGQKAAQAARSFVSDLRYAMKEGGMAGLTGERQGWSDAARAASAESRMQRMADKPIEIGATYTSRKNQAYTVEKVENGKVHITMRGGVRLAYDERQFRDQIMPGAKVKLPAQSSMFGEPSTKDKIDARSRALQAKGRLGDAMDDGLFGQSHKQTDIVDMAKSKAPAGTDIASRLKGLKKEQLRQVVKDMNGYDAPKTASKASLIEKALLSRTAYETSAAKSVNGAGQRVANASSAAEGLQRLDAKLSAAIDKARSGLRGTQNPNNQAAIQGNRSAKAKPTAVPTTRGLSATERMVKLGSAASSRVGAGMMSTEAYHDRLGKMLEASKRMQPEVYTREGVNRAYVTGGASYRTPAVPGSPADKAAIASMTLKDLRALAKERGVSLAGQKGKDAIVARLTGAKPMQRMLGKAIRGMAKALHEHAHDDGSKPARNKEAEAKWGPILDKLHEDAKVAAAQQARDAKAKAKPGVVPPSKMQRMVDKGLGINAQMQQSKTAEKLMRIALTDKSMHVDKAKAFAGVVGKDNFALGLDILGDRDIKRLAKNLGVNAKNVNDATNAIYDAVIGKSHQGNGRITLDAGKVIESARNSPSTFPADVLAKHDAAMQRASAKDARIERHSARAAKNAVPAQWPTSMGMKPGDPVPHAITTKPPRTAKAAPGQSTTIVNSTTGENIKESAIKSRRGKRGPAKMAGDVQGMVNQSAPANVAGVNEAKPESREARRGRITERLAASSNLKGPDLDAAVDKHMAALDAKESSGLRGTQNAANQEAIQANRKANAKPSNKGIRNAQAEYKRVFGSAPPSGANVEWLNKELAKRATPKPSHGGTHTPDGKHFPNLDPNSKLGRAFRGPNSLKVQEAMKNVTHSLGKASEALTRVKDGLDAFPKIVDGMKDLAEKLGGKNKMQRMIDMPERRVAAGAPAAPESAVTKAGRRTVAALGPVAIASAALHGANDAKAKGESQLKAAAVGAGESAVSMGGFMLAQHGATKLAIKAGMTAAKAIPAVNAVMIAGGAIHGAATAKPGERLKGAVKGGWDMSLPGMVVNTAHDAASAIKGRVAPTSDVASGFDKANAQFRANQSGSSGNGHSRLWGANSTTGRQNRGLEALPDSAPPAKNPRKANV